MSDSHAALFKKLSETNPANGKTYSQSLLDIASDNGITNPTKVVANAKATYANATTPEGISETSAADVFTRIAKSSLLKGQANGADKNAAGNWRMS